MPWELDTERMSAGKRLTREGCGERFADRLTPAREKWRVLLVRAAASSPSSAPMVEDDRMRCKSTEETKLCVLRKDWSSVSTTARSNESRPVPDPRLVSVRGLVLGTGRRSESREGFGDLEATLDC